MAGHSTVEKKKTRTLEEINAEIEQIKKEIAEAKGEDCEVYTRIVGYYRSVKNWNKGKKEEYNQRKLYKDDNPRTTEMCACGNESAPLAHKEIA